MRPGSVAAILVDGAASFERFSPAERHRLAALLLLGSSVTMAAMMASLKLAVGVMSLWQVMVLRAGLAALLCLPVFWAARIPILPRRHLRLYALRVGLALGGLTCWLYSIAHLPLGTASAISFAKGFFVLWLAALVLGERITKVKVACTLVGFLGVVLVLDPGSGGTLFAGLMGVAGALFGGLLTVVIKRLSATEPTIRLMFFPLAGMALIFAVPAMRTWQPMDGAATLLAGAMVVFGMISQWCFLNAYRLGEVSALAPVEYSRLVTAALAGYLVFAEVPSPLAFLGMAVIVAASYAALRYARAGPEVALADEGRAG